jgi:hypothetical protein
MSLFDVEKRHIEQLDSDKLIKVLRKLLNLEANKFAIPQSAANVYLNINDPDGGEDGRIKWENGPQKTVWIPNRFTIFQSKAQTLSPEDCKKEILNSKKKIKSKVGSSRCRRFIHIFLLQGIYRQKYRCQNQQNSQYVD